MGPTNIRVQELEREISQTFKTQHAIERLLMEVSDVISLEATTVLRKEVKRFEAKVDTLKFQLSSIQESCAHEPELASDDRSNWDYYKCKKCDKYL